MAELLPVSTRGAKGLMDAGVRVHTGIISVPANGTINLPYRVAGFLMLKNGYAWGGYHCFVGYMNAITQVSKTESFNPVVPTSISDGYVTVSNNASSERQFRYVIFNLSDPNDKAGSLID